jgi:hypothetical protein
MTISAPPASMHDGLNPIVELGGIGQDSRATLPRSRYSLAINRRSAS